MDPELAEGPCAGPYSTGPRRICSSLALVSSSSRSPTLLGCSLESLNSTAASVEANSRELIFATSWPDVPAHRGVGRDEAHALRLSVLGRQPLEQCVRVWGKPNLQCAKALVDARSIEDDHTAGAFQRDEAREHVHELPALAEPRRVEDVVSVEEVERRLRHAAVSAPRRARPPPPR